MPTRRKKTAESDSGRERREPTFEFRIAEKAVTCGSVLQALAALLIEIDESKQAEPAREKQAG